MNVLQLTIDYPPPLTGGLPRQVHGLSHALATRHTVGVVTCGPDRQDGPIQVFGADSLPGLLPSSDMTHLARVNFGLAMAVAKAKTVGPWDLVHAHDWMVAPAAVFASEVLDVPVVASIHTDAGARLVGSGENRLRRLDWEATLAGVSSLLLAVSTPIHDAIARRYPDISSRILPNGIDPSPFRTAQAGREEHQLLFVGRLVPYKGCHDVIRALALLRAEWPTLELEIVGDGFSRPELQRLVEELGLTESVSFRGWLEGDALAATYSRATTVIVPSHEEAFGLVAIEAMAAGAPVVASAIPAFNSYIEDGRSGILAEPGDPGDLARQVDRLLRDPALRSSVARSAFAQIVPRHEWGTVLNAAEAAYRDVIGQ